MQSRERKAIWRFVSESTRRECNWVEAQGPIFGNVSLLQHYLECQFISQISYEFTSDSHICFYTPHCVAVWMELL